MARSREYSVMTLDLAAASLTAALLFAGVWDGFIRPSSAQAELTRLRAELELKRKDLATLERESDNFNVTLHELEQQLSGAGAPPTHSPIEEDLRTINELMRRTGLNVSEVSPMATTTYPGILESRYRLRAGGQCADIARALHEFQGCRFWGDITHLQIGVPGGPKRPAGEARELDLTLSFYSASDRPSPPAGRK